MPIQTTPRSIARIAYIIFLGAMLTFAGYRGRCKLFTCQPATWSDIQVIAQTYTAKAGPNYRIGIVRAEPTFRTDFTSDGPYDITIRIELVAAQRDMTHDGMYHEQMIEFTDRDQWISWQKQRAWTSNPPSLESQQRLSRVRVSPRDIYRITWNVARRELSSSAHLSAASMSLYTDELPQERFGVESAWAISYYDDVDYLTYWIDAQTGKMIQQTKERFRKP